MASKLSTQQLKLNGSFRKDRHGKREASEKKFIELSPFKKGDYLEQPESITDNYVREYYKHHTALLIELQILQAVDLPELEMLYSLLQQEREVRRRLMKIDIGENLNEWERLSKISVKLTNAFTNLAKKYYISPIARTKLLLDNLQLEKAKTENSIIKKIINKK